MNLCDIEDETVARKRKNALSAIDMQMAEETKHISKEKTQRKKDGKSQGSTAKCQLKAEDVKNEGKWTDERNMHRRKQGVVVGIDPKVDEYVRKLKQADRELNLEAK